jgi:Arc/MetJ-type ribon-helix-helix transcriptional regulator
MKKTKETNVEAFSLAPLMRKQITALIDSGYYTSRSDVIKDAMRNLLESKKELALAAAICMYNSKEISLDEALLISGKNDKEFLAIAKKRRK